MCMCMNVYKVKSAFTKSTPILNYVCESPEKLAHIHCVGCKDSTKRTDWPTITQLNYKNSNHNKHQMKRRRKEERKKERINEEIKRNGIMEIVV